MRHKSCRTPGSQRTICINEDDRDIKPENIKVKIDNRQITVPRGTTILEAAKKLEIEIPAICTHEDLHVVGNCRLCSVKVEGYDALQTACSFPITKPVNIRTYGKDIRKVRKNLVELMLPKSCYNCATCGKKGNCEFELIFKRYGITELSFADTQTVHNKKDQSGGALVMDMDKCILCRRCARTCIDLQEVGTLDVAGKGVTTRITTFLNRKLSDVVCISCGQCAVRCPTGALTIRDDTKNVFSAIDNPVVKTTVQVSPWLKASIGEMFEKAPGEYVSSSIVTALKRTGFDRVYDSSYGEDIYMVELIKFLFSRVWKNFNALHETSYPLLSSDCPGWVNYVEHYIPEVIDNLFPYKPPVEIMDIIIKNELKDFTSLLTVAATPCTPLKKEQSASSKHKNDISKNGLDLSLTTVETGGMIKACDLNPFKLQPAKYDILSELNFEAGGFSTGLAETLITVLVKIITGKTAKTVKEYPIKNCTAYVLKAKIDSTVDVPDYLFHLIPSFNFLKGEFLIGRCSTTAAAKKVIENIDQKGLFSKCVFIEFQACLDGCAGAGGQPGRTSYEIRKLRSDALSKSKSVRFSDKKIRTINDLLIKNNGELQNSIKREFSLKGKFMV
ncbi:MAG: (2Fe-2S)-binding protein [Deltaproteobacteria bacterium]|nr:(2Fe-2S)-binding protein [Deltaproteobacteria bacterium]